VATTHLVTTYLIEVMPKVFKLDTLPMDRPVLSTREMEVLKWTSAGKSAWEIGQILSIAESTVNAHLSRVRGAFGVSTKAHAIARAAMLGMLAA
jgi:DNA-binding CsgD family transcriptional regulator